MKANQSQREEKFAMIERWQASRISQKVFCQQQEDIPYWCFHYWLHKYRKKLPQEDGQFIKLKTPATQADSEVKYSEVIFANGNRVAFYHPLSSQELKQLAG